MREYLAFTKKEFIENIRTYKLMIMVIVFAILGLMGPLFAKFSSDILRIAGIDPSAIGMGNPTMMDSWTQFFKNVGQTGLFVLVIIFCGVMANEFSRGTLINILTKGMRRSTVIFSKFTILTVIWTISYVICLIISYIYTTYYFTMEKMNWTFVAFFSMWLFGVFLIALIIFGGVLFKTVYGSLFFTGGIIVILSLINIFPNSEKYNPKTLSSSNMQLLIAQKTISDFTPAIIICIAIIIAIIIASILAFDKKQL